MLTIEEALRLVVENSRALSPRRMALSEAAGLVLAEDVTSEVNSPPYDKALMDGYAVRCADREPQRRVLEEIAAGDVPQFPLTPGTASRIMTGAPMPDGANAVVPIELTEMTDESIVSIQNVDIAPGKNLLRLGTSLRVGDAVLKKGAELRPIEIAILAEIGHSMITAIPRPKLAVLPTGNELVPVGDRPAAGQIRNSNGPMLLASAIRADTDANELGIARDDRQELARCIQQGLSADILVLSGGVSAGKFDLVPQVLAELGVKQIFHKVALRPGKPLWFGVKNDSERRVLVFALPGNPVSSLVCFELFVRPAIEILSGRGFTEWATTQGKLMDAYDHAGGRAACLPARLSSAPQKAKHAATEHLPPGLEILPWHGSADIATLTQANALALFPVEARQFEPGHLINVFPL
jgi:molybdopterin molybdotransferase